MIVVGSKVDRFRKENADPVRGGHQPLIFESVGTVTRVGPGEAHVKFKFRTYIIRLNKAGTVNRSRGYFGYWFAEHDSKYPLE